jgi:hypothetical protein
MSKLSLEALTVETFETFETAGAGDAELALDPSRRYSRCDSCGIACTAIDCPVPSANYTDCGSCGIACTAIEPC